MKLYVCRQMRPLWYPLFEVDLPYCLDPGLAPAARMSLLLDGRGLLRLLTCDVMWRHKEVCVARATDTCMRYWRVSWCENDQHYDQRCRGITLPPRRLVRVSLCVMCVRIASEQWTLSDIRVYVQIHPWFITRWIQGLLLHRVRHPYLQHKNSKSVCTRYFICSNKQKKEVTWIIGPYL